MYLLKYYPLSTPNTHMNDADFHPSLNFDRRPKTCTRSPAIILFRTPNCSNILAQSRRPRVLLWAPWFLVDKKPWLTRSQLILYPPRFLPDPFFASLPIPCVVGIDEIVLRTRHSIPPVSGKNRYSLLYRDWFATLNRPHTPWVI